MYTTPLFGKHKIVFFVYNICSLYVCYKICVRFFLIKHSFQLFSFCLHKVCMCVCVTLNPFLPVFIVYMYVFRYISSNLYFVFIFVYIYERMVYSLKLCFSCQQIYAENSFLFDMICYNKKKKRKRSQTKKLLNFFF